MNEIRTLLLAIACFFIPPLSADPLPTHGASIFGDLKYPENFTHFEYVNPEAPKGGNVSLGEFGGFDTFNAFALKGTPARGTHGLHCTLLSNSEDEAGSAYAYLAEKIEIADDKKSVTFTLNKDAKFSDGTPVTADDVIFSFNTLIEKGPPFFADYYKDVKKAEKLDDLKVRFVFKTDKNRELPLVLGHLPVLSKAYYATHDFEKADLVPPVGCGPYQVKDFRAGQRIVYTRVPNWWGENIPSQKGQHNFDVTYIYYRDLSVLFEAFKAADFDFHTENIAKNWATGYNLPAVKEGRLIQKEFPHTLPATMQILTFNTRRPLFQDRILREALTKAFDFEWLNKNLFFSSYARNLSYFSNSPFACSGLPEGEELKILEPFRKDLPPEVFTDVFKLPISKGTGQDRQIKTEVNALLEKAGWIIKNGKRVNAKTGEPLSFELILSDSHYEKVALAYQRTLASFGIQMRIRILTLPQYIERIRKHDYDMICDRIPQGETPGNEQRQFWGSKSANEKSGNNAAGIQNPVVDQLVELVIASPTREALTTRVRALDRVLLWGYYGVPQWYSPTTRIAYWNKFGMPDKKPKDGVGFNTWWVVETKK